MLHCNISTVLHDCDFSVLVSVLFYIYCDLIFCMLLLTNVIIIMAHIKLFADLTTQGDTTEFNR